MLDPGVLASYCSIQDFAYHGLAAFFYLSASVILAELTIRLKTEGVFTHYKIDIAAVVRPQHKKNIVNTSVKQLGLSVQSV